MRNDNSDRRGGRRRQDENTKPINRIREALDELGKDLTWLASETGVSASSLSDYNRGRLPRVDAAVKIAGALGRSVAWLFPATGDDDAADSDSPIDAGEAVAGPSVARNRVAEIALLPVVSGFKASAGPGSLAGDALEEVGEPIPFPKRWLRREFGDQANLALIQVEGDSMSPDFPSGTWVMIDKTRKGPATGTYVIRLDNAINIKDVQFRPADVLITSRQSGYPERKLSPRDAADLSTFEVVGRVVWSGNLLA